MAIPTCFRFKHSILDFGFHSDFGGHNLLCQNIVFVKTEFTQINSSIFEQIVDRGRPICSLSDKSFPMSQVSDQFDNVDFQNLTIKR